MSGNSWRGALLSMVGGFCLLVGCTSPTPQSPVNESPVIIDMKSDCGEVAPGGRCMVECMARDPDGHTLSYNWSASQGQIVGHGAAVEWRAPEVEGLFQVSVEASDGHGAVVAESLMIAVRANQAPVIQSLDAKVDWLEPGGSCRIECKAEDPDGESIQYDWMVNGGTIYDRGRAATWVAPEAPGIYEIGVVVRDEEGALATRVLPVSVTLPGAPSLQGFIVTPIGHDLLRQNNGSYTVFRDRDYSIECIVDGVGELSYEWQAELGTLSGSGAVVEWEAPPGRREGTVRVVVTDEWGRVLTGTLVVTVETCHLCM